METIIIETAGKKMTALLSVLDALDIPFKKLFLDKRIKEARLEKQRGELKEIESKSFSEKIKKAEENYKNGEYTTIKDTKNIWESILSE